MKVKTNITKIKNGVEYIRDKKLSTCIKEASFSQTIFFLLFDKEANDKELTMFNAILVAAIDHGPGTASAQTARIVASAKNSTHTSVAAGILAMGERHGSAIKSAAEYFTEVNLDTIEQKVKEYKQNGKRIGGFGHAVLEVDERSETLLEVAQSLDFYGEHCKIAVKTQEVLSSMHTKKLPLNIDGAMAAILLDLGCPIDMMKGLFIIARTPGLVAQVVEEKRNDVGIRRMSEDDIS